MINSKLIKFIIYSLVFLIIVFFVWLVINIYGGENLKQIFSVKNSLQASLIGGNNTSVENQNNPQSDSQNNQNDSQNFKPWRDWSVEYLKIAAEAAICVEVSPSGQNKVLFEKNGGDDDKLPIASLTKLMTALVVLEDKDYDLDKVTVISQKAVDQPGGQGLLTAGEYLYIENLLYIMLIESSNDAAYSLAEVKGFEQFVDLMNLKAMELGLSRSNFADVAGLSSDDYSTAEDLVRFTKYLLENHPLIWEILSLDKFKLYTPQGKFHHELSNTNELLGKIPDIVGGKTGETDEAKGCLLLVLKNQKDQNYLIYIILGSDDRFGEMQKLIDWVNQAYQW